MQFNATVTFNESAEVLKRQEDAREAKELLFKALQIIAKEDDSVLAEAEAYLKGAKA